MGTKTLFQRRLFSFLKVINPAVVAPIITICGTIIISVITVLLAKHLEKKEDVRKDHRDKKIIIYEEFIEFAFKLFFAVKIGIDPPTEKETLIYFNKFMRSLISWGGDAVLKAFAEFRQIRVQENSVNFDPKVLFVFENIIYEMRKDLGHSNKGLGKGDILRIMINNFDDSVIIANSILDK